jgi:Na+/H+-dicarboxylate symporter
LRLKLHWQILIALVLAVAVGSLTRGTDEVFGVQWLAVYTFVGALFLNALKMIIVPLIVSSMISGITSMGTTEGLGRMGGKTLLFYMTSSLIAILTGLFFVNLIAPGMVNGEPATGLVDTDAASAAQLSDNLGGHGLTELFNVFLSMVPPNVVAAAAEGQMLGLIFFSLLFGYFMTRIEGVRGKLLADFWQGVLDVMMAITDWVMKFAPIGVFALVAKTVAGIDDAQMETLVISLGAFMLTVLGALAFHVLVTLPAILYLVGRVNPLLHYRAVMPALLTAFSTSSSSATLPLTMECVRDNAGVSNRTTSFVLPLGATINMDGTALYECVAAMFIAQVYGIELSFATQFLILFVALLTSVGVAGVPAASLVAITIILSAIGLPVEAIGLILAVDRLLDMFRTAVNVLSDTCCAVVIARSEGESRLYPALASGG